MARAWARAVSSVGRASRLHREGRRFEPVTAHQRIAETNPVATRPDGGSDADTRRRCPRPSPGSARLAEASAEGAGNLERHHPAGPERMDLLGGIGEEGGDPAQADRLGLRKPDRREAASLLLARVPSPVEGTLSKQRGDAVDRGDPIDVRGSARAFVRPRSTAGWRRPAGVRRRRGAAAAAGPGRGR